MTETINIPAPLGAPPAGDALLDVRNLKTYFHVLDGVVPAVDGVSFSLGKGQTLGIVGESGSGKSVTALTIMRLLDIPPAEIVEGEVWFDGREILSMPIDKMRKIRGNDVSMIFQEPLTSLNPVFTIGDQIAEQVELHMKVSRKEAWDRAIESLQLVGIPLAERRVKQYPHELSGGMRQRVMIAMALINAPELLIADEPTTALDVTVQAQILELITNLQGEFGITVIMITHDLGIVADVADDVAVMYGGRIVEVAPTGVLYARPEMPYTLGLLSSIPRMDRDSSARLEPIPGNPPSPISLPAGCVFQPRCTYSDRVAGGACLSVRPDLLATADGHLVRCHLPAEERRQISQGVLSVLAGGSW